MATAPPKDATGATASSEREPVDAPCKLPDQMKLLGITNPLRILLVEDNPINQKVTAKYLRQLGYTRCDMCSNGREVIDLLKGRKKNQGYDVIFMDLNMPEMNGHETAEQIRCMYPEEEQPVIVAVTSSDSIDDTMKCLQLGFEHYVSKPINALDLASILLKCEALDDYDEDEDDEESEYDDNDVAESKVADSRSRKFSL